MKLVWLDMEMSGLDTNQCRILEVAVQITGENFAPLACYEAIVYQPPEILNAMDDWCRETHSKSGLTVAVAKGKPEKEVEKEILDLLNQHFTDQERPILCGNSIGQDRKFIDHYWPELAKRLHYRMLDVTSFKIVFSNLFKMDFHKTGSHRALDDIKESIAELKFYLSRVTPKDSANT